MIFPFFSTEQWMTDYEGRARINLADTCMEPCRLDDLTALDPDALKDVVLDYGSITGEPELKKQILSLYQSGTEDNITLSHGGLNANQHVFECLLAKGDRAVTLTPGYQQFLDLPEVYGAKVQSVELEDTPSGWRLDFDALEKAMEGAKMLILNSPCNPTGFTLDEAGLKKCVKIARKQDAWILCDECHRPPHDPDFPSISDLYEKGIATGTLSKTVGLAGLRFGWIKADENLITRINQIRDYTIISTGPLCNRLALAALRNIDALWAPRLARVEANQKIVQDWLDQEPLFDCHFSKGCTVAFLHYHMPVDTRQFCLDLLEKTGILFVPGGCFGHEGYLRLGLGKNQPQLPETLKILSDFARQYV